MTDQSETLGARVAEAARVSDRHFARFRREASVTSWEAQLAMMMSVIATVPDQDLQVFRESVLNLIEARPVGLAMAERIMQDFNGGKLS